VHHPVRHLRWDPELEEFQHQCRTCREWWPLSLEHWQPAHGLGRCRACWMAYYREINRVGFDARRSAARAARRSAA
jgi:hypothetical protein